MKQTEASKDAEAVREIADRDDQDAYLTKSIIRLMVGVMVSVVVMSAALSWVPALKDIVIQLVGLFGMLAGVIAGKFGTRFDHRYGSARSSSTVRDVVGMMAEKSKREGDTAARQPVQVKEPVSVVNVTPKKGPQTSNASASNPRRPRR